MSDVFSKEKRSEIMSKIRGKWTKQERRFYEENPRAVPHPNFPYHPDFLLNGNVVFLDSAFWHGQVSRKNHERQTEFWKEKLFRNIVRDECANSLYGYLGVLRRILDYHTSLSSLNFKKK